MTSPDIQITITPSIVWRVGFRPNPWAWTDWKYAQDNGRFSGRWDDQLSQFRTIYTANSLYACLIELLAKLRPAADVVDELLAIEDPDDEGARYLEYDAGLVDFSWFERRAAGQANQGGRYCQITHSSTVAALRPYFPLDNFNLGGVDFDASLLKDAEVRPVTRSVARWMYEQTNPADGSDLVDGLAFQSRHGDDLHMWAVFERPNDGDVSPRFARITSVELSPETPALTNAMRLHGLRFA